MRRTPALLPVVLVALSGPPPLGCATAVEFAEPALRRVLLCRIVPTQFWLCFRSSACVPVSPSCLLFCSRCRRCRRVVRCGRRAQGGHVSLLGMGRHEGGAHGTDSSCGAEAEDEPCSSGAQRRR